MRWPMRSQEGPYEKGRWRGSIDPFLAPQIPKQAPFPEQRCAGGNLAVAGFAVNRGFCRRRVSTLRIQIFMGGCHILATTLRRIFASQPRLAAWQCRLETRSIPKKLCEAMRFGAFQLGTPWPYGLALRG